MIKSNVEVVRLLQGKLFLLEDYLNRDQWRIEHGEEPLDAKTVQDARDMIQLLKAKIAQLQQEENSTKTLPHHLTFSFMKRYCLALDLKDDPQLIAEYERMHAPGAGWPEVRENDLKAGVRDLQIYRTGNRMVMILETDDDFSFEKKAGLDAVNPHVQEWERLMWGYQQALPNAKPGEKWVLMEKIFQFEP